MSVLHKLRSRQLRRLSRCYSSEDIFRFHPDQPVISDHRVLDEHDYQRFVSRRAAAREPALTRTMTSLAYKVGRQMLSLAEGMPNEGVFPFRHLQLTTTAGGTLTIDGAELATALQYVPSQGLPCLLQQLREYQTTLHRPPPLPRDVLVTCGSQHGIHHVVELLLEPGDPVLTTQFAYTGLHSALRPYHPEILGIPEDADGLVPARLEEVLHARARKGLKLPKMLYLVPTGNNPTGTVLPEARRRRIYELACQYDFLIVEDDPYMFLNYDEPAPPSFLSLDSVGRVIRLDSLSKVVSAGLRAAWLTAPAPLLAAAERLQQAELLHPCTLSQTIMHRLLSDRPALSSQLQSARELYGRRRAALGAALRQADPAADWTEPKAGLFYWLRVRELDDIYNMVFNTAFKRGLMVVPGQAFLFDTNAPCQYVRLTFSKIKMEDIDTAARHLADIIEDEQKLRLQTRAASER
ncbi:kynurenine/alpha-aminoadipate aminotransferase, mitochondrial [Aricia agestis]|uniref:kynurenine/alpha-aminoadipate aminotransferase, mitochondrial n=1 Tax=Aricia agestis TaxID=91739 RepID=UPI001C206252|nr:kynurenine/alpha-aminoadipate aminotransferase, mitochondrial [Aricia agestis]XP_041972045.1 kynurenine/alpha-aminoadipate aminotransferase, mitochondrial [Aricia agestis]